MNMPENQSVLIIGGTSGMGLGAAKAAQDAGAAVVIAGSSQEAVELSPIRVNVIIPGLIDTLLSNGMPVETKQAFFKAEAQRLPANRVDQPSDIGSAFVYLAGNTFVTGTALEVNGGWSLA